MPDQDGRMPTIYLHIGAPKTATSTLQSVLARNAKGLLKHGVLYPESIRSADAHHALACDLIEKYQGNTMSDVWYGDVPRGEGWQLLRREIEQHGDRVDAVVVSSELFFGQSRRLRDMLHEMADQLGGYQVKVVVYLRRQDQLYSSFYNQDIKGMRQWSASAYEFYQTHQMFQRDYHDRLGMWSDVLGKQNIVLRPFEPGQWPNGDIVHDFCRCLGVKPVASRYRDKNESLGVTQLYVKRCLNRVGFDKRRNDSVVKVLTTLVPEEPAKNCLYIHRGLYRQYREQWMDVNSALSSDYLEGRPLFNEPIPEPAGLALYEVNEQSLAGYVDTMMKAFGSGKYREHRELFARATLLALAECNLWHILDKRQRNALLEWV
jgi:hypothetical protein